MFLLILLSNLTSKTFAQSDSLFIPIPSASIQLDTAYRDPTGHYIVWLMTTNNYINRTIRLQENKVLKETSKVQENTINLLQNNYDKQESLHKIEIDKKNLEIKYKDDKIKSQEGNELKIKKLKKSNTRLMIVTIIETIAITLGIYSIINR